MAPVTSSVNSSSGAQPHGLPRVVLDARAARGQASAASAAERMPRPRDGDRRRRPRRRRPSGARERRLRRRRAGGGRPQAGGTRARSARAADSAVKKASGPVVLRLGVRRAPGRVSAPTQRLDAEADHRRPDRAAAARRAPSCPGRSRTPPRCGGRRRSRRPTPRAMPSDRHEREQEQPAGEPAELQQHDAGSGPAPRPSTPPRRTCGTRRTSASAIQT